MTPPPQYGPPAAAPGNDKVTLWGVLGIVFALCCWPLGLVFAILSLRDARRYGRPPTLAYVAFGLIILRFLLDVIFTVTGAYSDWVSRY